MRQNVNEKFKQNMISILLLHFIIFLLGLNIFPADDMDQLITNVSVKII